MIKLGIALGGGGARGSYQLGVIKALREENLLEDLKVVSGTSIGSFNACLLLEEMTDEQMYEVWESINNETLYKESFDRFKNDRLGMFDQTKMYDILVEKSNKEKISNSKIKGLVAVCKIGDNGIIRQLKRSSMKAMFLKLNNNDDPHRAILASSSMPIIFGATMIDGAYYVDGGMMNNLPINALEKEKCNVMLAVALNKVKQLKVSNPDAIVVDFSPKKSISTTPLGILDFSSVNLKTRSNHGYETAIKMIEKLKDDGVIVDGKWNLDKPGIYR